MSRPKDSPTSSTASDPAAAAGPRTWTAPTRRRFLGLLMATGAVAVTADTVRRTAGAPARPRPRWIGHC